MVIDWTLAPTASALGLLVLAASIVFVRFVPQLNTFLLYGKTLDRKNVSKDSPFLRTAATLYVPKRWFAHFYIVIFLAAMALWYRAIYYSRSSYILLIFFSVQSARRLWESFYVERMSPHAKMHVFHYIAGLFFYFCVTQLVVTSRNTQGLFNVYSLALSFAFAYLSYTQYTYHRYLATLVKYSLPQKGLFKVVACPHYLCEVLIYALFLAVDPSNLLAQAISIFTVVNLTISAEQTKLHYQAKFPKNAPKFGIVPWVA